MQDLHNLMEQIVFASVSTQDLGRTDVACCSNSAHEQGQPLRFHVRDKDSAEGDLKLMLKRYRPAA